MKLKKVLEQMTVAPWKVMRFEERGRVIYQVGPAEMWFPVDPILGDNTGAKELEVFVRANAMFVSHCRDRFEGLVKALEKATTIIENEYPDNGCEEGQFAQELRQLLDDVNEVEEI